MSKSSILISICGNADSSDWEIGKSVLSLLESVDRRLLPERMGNSEPLKEMFTGIPSAQHHWAPEVKISYEGSAFFAKSNFLWIRKKAIKGSGHVMHRSVNRFGDVKPTWLLIKYAFDKKVDWLRLFKEMCVLLKASYGTLHLLTQIETREDAFGEAADASYATSDFVDGLPPIGLTERGLANISWANYFGSALRDEVPEEKICAAGFQIEHCGEGVLLRVTEELLTVEEDFAEFSRRRSALRKMFREGLFRINHEPLGLNSSA